MKIKLRDLCKLISEAIDSALPKISAGKAYVSQTNGDIKHYMIIKEIDNGLTVTGYASTVTGDMWEDDKGNLSDMRRLEMLWADDPASALFVLAVALFEEKNVVPDHSVAPNAQAILKRYYLTYKEDPKRIEDKVLDINNDKPWLNAVYHAVPGWDGSAAKKNGEKLVEKEAEKATLGQYEIIDELRMKGRTEFVDAYSDPTKTGHLTSLDDLLKLSDPMHMIGQLSGMTARHKSRQKAAGWLKDNKQKIYDKYENHPNFNRMLDAISDYVLDDF